MSYTILLDTWDECPACWRGFIMVLRNEYTDAEWIYPHATEIIQKALEPYNASYKSSHTNGICAESCVKFENEEDVIAFKLRFGL